MRVTLDTNVLVYAFDSSAGIKHQIGYKLLERSRRRDCIMILQTLAELFRTLTGRYAIPTAEAKEVVDAHRKSMPTFAADQACLVDAMDAVTDHQLAFWDAMIWATARRAGCRLLISEDGQDGRTLGGVTIVNPFAPVPSPLIERALGPSE